MTRGGRARQSPDPERRCAVTGETGPKAGLVRFVVGPESQIVPDILGRLPGRGIWVSADRSALDRAGSKGIFARAARQKVTVPDGLADRVETALARRVTELVSMARKAGLAVAGYEKVKSWIDSGRAEVLLQAHDGSERGRSKLRAPHGSGSLVSVLDASELGFAFGRENVIHAALAGGGLTTRVVEEAARLSGLRAKIGGDVPAGKGNTTI
ncbi:MAG: RNA-binding protein [Pseudomonadota bacterium]